MRIFPLSSNECRCAMRLKSQLREGFYTPSQDRTTFTVYKSLALVSSGFSFQSDHTYSSSFQVLQSLIQLLCRVYPSELLNGEFALIKQVYDMRDDLQDSGISFVKTLLRMNKGRMKIPSEDWPSPISLLRSFYTLSKDPKHSLQ